MCTDAPDERRRLPESFVERGREQERRRWARERHAAATGRDGVAGADVG